MNHFLSQTCIWGLVALLPLLPKEGGRVAEMAGSRGPQVPHLWTPDGLCCTFISAKCHCDRSPNPHLVFQYSPPSDREQKRSGEGLSVPTSQSSKKMSARLWRTWRGLPSCRHFGRQWVQRQVKASGKQVKARVDFWVDSIAATFALYSSCWRKLNYIKDHFL